MVERMLLLVGLLAIGPGTLWAQGTLVGAQASREALPELRRFDGVVEAISRTTVSAQTSGRVVEIVYDVDDLVQKGALILRLDDARQRAALELAQANQAEAKARSEEATSELRRVTDLHRRKLVADAELDRARASRDAAVARLEGAEAAVASAREELERTRVRAPYTGVVTARHVELGESASPGTPLLSGLSLEQLRVIVRVPQRDVGAIRERAAAEVLVPAAAGARSIIAAESIVVFPVAEPNSNSFPVRVNLPPGDFGLAPGMLVKVAFQVGVSERLMVPAAAVFHRSELSAVYVLDVQGRPRLRQVRIGQLRGDRIEILAGLDAGEVVALDPVAAAIAIKRGVGGP